MEELNISDKIYDLMLRKGYPAAFARIISAEMNTEFTGNRMYGYIARNDLLRLEDVADEMLAIKSDRDRIRSKHMSEQAQSAINMMYMTQGEEENE